MAFGYEGKDYHGGSGATSFMGGAGPEISACVAEECDRVLWQELAEVAGRLHADCARKAKERELDVWKQLKVLSPVRRSSQSTDVADARWALTWKEVEGVKAAKARLVAKS